MKLGNLCETTTTTTAVGCRVRLDELRHQGRCLVGVPDWSNCTYKQTPNYICHIYR
ncbi:hypothetical protein Hanom_Chr14g01283391 [Helianthus anomalus]